MRRISILVAAPSAAAGRCLFLATVCVSFLAGVASTQTITTVAGGGVPPLGLAATLWSAAQASGAAVDGGRNLYVAVTDLHQVWVVNPAGAITEVIGTGVAGYSGDGGPATAARLNHPSGLAVDVSGNLYIADTSNHVIRKVAASTGAITTFAGTGTYGYSGDGGLATGATLLAPAAVAVGGPQGNIFVADTGNNVIRQVNVSTRQISTVAGTGVAGYHGDNGPAVSAQLNQPGGIAVEASGAIDIADTQNNVVRRVTQPAGVITTVAGNGISGFGVDGVAATSTEMLLPRGIVIDASGNICVADGNKIRRFAVGGAISTIAGNGTNDDSGDGGPATSAALGLPQNIAIDGAGNIYVPEGAYNVVRVFAPGGNIRTIAGNGSQAIGGDGGLATSALLQPQTVAVDSAGNIYSADGPDSVVRKIEASTGVITTVAGTGIQGYSGDGGPATSATLSEPFGVAVDSDRNLYIATNNAIRKVAASTGVITTVAGGFSELNGLAVDAAGNIYVADTFNSVIRMVAASTGVITTVAGTGGLGYSGDGGPATSATLFYPTAVALDGSGNLYIADGSDTVRKVAASTGVITAVAGAAYQAHYSGDGGPATSATLNQPYGVALDASDNLYIADLNNNVIRKVTASTGIITTIAGTGAAGYSGDSGPASSARLNFPSGIAVGLGGLYIPDQGNLRIRKVTLPAMAPPPLTLTCNPASGPAAVGVAYSSTCTAAGGTQPYSFVLPVNGVAGNSVPAGVNFTATATAVVIAGTPTAPGNYHYAISVTDSESSPQSATVTFTPAIMAATSTVTVTNVSTIQFSGGTGQTAAQCAANGGVCSATFTLTASSNITYQISSSVAWLSASPLSGTATTSGITISVTANPSSLNPGNYSGTLTVSCTAPNSCSSVQVGFGFSVSATPKPTLVPNMSTVSFAAYTGRGNPAAQMLTVSASDGSQQSFSVGGVPAWLGVSPLSGITGQSTGTLILTPNASAAPVNGASGSFMITPSNGSAAIKVGVSLSFSPFSISANPTPITISVQEGGTASQTVSIQTIDGGAATISISVSGSSAVTVSSPPTTVPAKVTVNANAAGLQAGSSPSATITITCAAANPCTAVTVPVQLSVTAGPGPSIERNGVVPLNSSATTVEQGEWIVIYGNNLATGTYNWNGDFPQSLGGTSVTIDGKPAYLYFANETQVNAQVPNDSATGTVPVVVTTPTGSSTSSVTLGAFGPSFSLLDSTHVAGIILRSDGSGGYGSGSNSYDIIGPTGTSLGYKTVAAKAGDSVVLYGVGFGPTGPQPLAGMPVSGAPTTTNTVTMLINNVSVTLSYSGLSYYWLYQFNLTLPAGLGAGDVPLEAIVGGTQTPSNVVISLQ